MQKHVKNQPLFNNHFYNNDRKKKIDGKIVQCDIFTLKEDL